MEKEQWAQLIRLVKANFGEVLSCWLHLKAIRVFVESVLRYGLPPDFMSAVIEPHAKQDKKTRDILNQMFDSHKAKKDKAMEQEFEEMSLIAGVDKEFYAYVTFQVQFSIE
jgi:V-type H+-transporting ATPase subunit C